MMETTGISNIVIVIIIINKCFNINTTTANICCSHIVLIIARIQHQHHKAILVDIKTHCHHHNRNLDMEEGL